MVKIKIDNKDLEVAEGTTVLQAALANKVDVPYFCYHPKLSIAGNCRMCLVNIKGQGKPAISCREQVKQGTGKEARHLIEVLADAVCDA